MSEGYFRSIVDDNKDDQIVYRDSGFDDGQLSNKEDEIEMNIHNQKINSYMTSVATDAYPKNEGENESKCLKSDEFKCIINLLASALGGGCFVFPYILYEIGIINSLIIFIFLSISIYYSLDLLRIFVVNSKFFSFSFITQHTLGNLWQKIYAISAFLFYMSYIINYLELLHKFIRSMLDFLKDGWGKIIYFLISCIIQILLCLFTNKISKLYYFSLIVVIIFIIILIVLIIKSIFLFSSGEFKHLSLFTLEINNKTNWKSFLFITSKIIEFFYGFIYHSTFPTLLSGLDNISNSKTKKIQNISFILLFFFYIIISFFGCSFYDENSELILVDQIAISNDILKYIFKSILILLFIILIPIRYIVIRDNYTSLIGQDILQLKYEILITSICLIISNIIVFFTGESKNFMSILIHYFGGALGVFICFVLPIISFISLNPKGKLRAIFGYIIGGIFIVIGFFSIFHNIQSEDDGITN